MTCLAIVPSHSERQVADGRIPSFAKMFSTPWPEGVAEVSGGTRPQHANWARDEWLKLGSLLEGPVHSEERGVIRERMTDNNRRFRIAHSRSIPELSAAVLPRHCYQGLPRAGLFVFNVEDATRASRSAPRCARSPRQ